MTGPGRWLPCSGRPALRLPSQRLLPTRRADQACGRRAEGWRFALCRIAWLLAALRGCGGASGRLSVAAAGSCSLPSAPWGQWGGLQRPLPPGGLGSRCTGQGMMRVPGWGHTASLGDTQLHVSSQCLPPSQSSWPGTDGRFWFIHPKEPLGDSLWPDGAPLSPTLARRVPGLLTMVGLGVHLSS